MTLIALLNLTTHDIQVEGLNEENDTANYYTNAQMQQFDTVESNNPQCLPALYANYVNKTYNDYILCDNGNQPNNGIPAVAGCSGSTYSLYPQSGFNSAGNYQYINDSSSSGSCASTTPSSTQISYKERLVVVNTTSTQVAGVTYYTLESQSELILNTLTQQKENLSLDEVYDF